ncbi:hypothetical protein EDD86DRAFT_270931 [Gorgonomyces haynaldii]|nr:hypothetical protein EDD86DRAFT_270931 [Gorgonomyces haynaldii]
MDSHQKSLGNMIPLEESAYCFEAFAFDFKQPKLKHKQCTIQKMEPQVTHFTTVDKFQSLSALYGVPQNEKQKMRKPLVAREPQTMRKHIEPTIQPAMRFNLSQKPVPSITPKNRDEAAVPVHDYLKQSEASALLNDQTKYHFKKRVFVIEDPLQAAKLRRNRSLQIAERVRMNLLRRRKKMRPKTAEISLEEESAVLKEIINGNIGLTAEQVEQTHRQMQATLGLNDDLMQTGNGYFYSEENYFTGRRRKSSMSFGAVEMYTPMRKSHIKDNFQHLHSKIQVPKQVLVKTRAKKPPTPPSEETKIARRNFVFFDDFRVMLEREMNQQNVALSDLGKTDLLVQQSLVGQVSFEDTIDMVMNLQMHMDATDPPVTIEMTEWVYQTFANPPENALDEVKKILLSMDEKNYLILKAFTGHMRRLILGCKSTLKTGMISLFTLLLFKDTEFPEITYKVQGLIRSFADLLDSKPDLNTLPVVPPIEQKPVFNWDDDPVPINPVPPVIPAVAVIPPIPANPSPEMDPTTHPMAVDPPAPDTQVLQTDVKRELTPPIDITYEQSPEQPSEHVHFRETQSPDQLEQPLLKSLLNTPEKHSKSGSPLTGILKEAGSRPETTHSDSKHEKSVRIIDDHHPKRKSIERRKSSFHKHADGHEKSMSRSRHQSFSQPKSEPVPPKLLIEELQDMSQSEGCYTPWAAGLAVVLENWNAIFGDVQ